MVSQIPPIINWIGLVIASVAAIIAAYKFILKRPRLQLIVDEGRFNTTVRNGQLSGIPSFHVVNRGYDLAQDVYLEIQLVDWNFGDRQRGATSGVEIATPVVGSQSPQQHHSNTDQSAGDQSTSAEEDDSSSGWSDVEEVHFTDSFLETKHERTAYIGRASTIHRVSIEDNIHAGSEFKLFWGKVRLERPRTYTLEYTIGCQTYGPRTGKIMIETGYDAMTVSYTHPRFWRAWWVALVDLLGRTRNSIVSRVRAIMKNRGVENYLPTKFGRKNWFARADVRYEPHGFFSLYFQPDAIVQVGLDGHQLRKLSAKVTIYLRKKEVTDTLATITFTGLSLRPGETWEITLPRELRRSLMLDWESHAHDPLEPPFLWGPKHQIPIWNPRRQLLADWTLSSSASDPGDTWGLEIIDDEFNNGRTRSVTGSLQNDNIATKHVYLTAKFYSEEERIICFGQTQVQVEGGEAETFDLQPDIDLDQVSRITDYEIVVRRGPG